MATEQVDKSEWKQFFDDFSRDHLGKSMTAQLHGRGTPGSEEAHALPFDGIALEEKGSEAGTVRIALGDKANDHIVHAIPHLSQVWKRSSDDAGGEMVELHGADGQTLILKSA